MADRDAFSSPFDEVVGTQVLEASGDRVVAQVDVGPHLHQPTGIVHGGVYATLVETTASVGASLWLDGDAFAVGLSNQTDFLRAVTGGRLRVEATPVQRGRTLQLWQVSITDEQQRLVASGRVRLMNRTAGT
ncbi:MAG TPA: PaaI family thioesterase [Egibacteraceae bacterium]|nr:PaaI family thioesterase [Egibacteraceae bacterium]